MSTISENKQVIIRFLESVWNRHDLNALTDFWHSDYRNHAVPEAYSRGMEALRAIHEPFFIASPDVSVEVLEQVAEDDLVCSHITSRGTHQGEFMGIAPTGKPWMTSGFRMDRIRDGKIIEHWGFFDLSGLQHQLREP